ncbi:solute carrier family 25 member 36 [Capsaspora owczarzaki ATCC 30864]|uniref:Solute carrier family 25 member 36 n=1 Tax=Capsaspora owczarzaki (strain ATCC 30864) TaxID=595528 RepID=A0A0D2WIJ4_CAPO3|nr:solute carrier family 25 member 36 [Capsaspora owczarzaki ATCC 30864]KJE88878.1 solute carrier family 25 member 36 [Capsaspora owczarzaki ATCC 30864]|eukprot:XP_004365322.2 solute carrier family 25 member 36 [Capsaspora owczarzaki ATCC 30864]
MEGAAASSSPRPPQSPLAVPYHARSGLGLLLPSAREQQDTRQGRVTATGSSSTATNATSAHLAATTPGSRPPPPAWAHMLGGGLGGTLGTVATSPLEIIKTRMQSSQHRSDPRAPRTIRTALLQLYRVEGPRALFRGLVPNLVGVAPSRSIYFFSYSKGKEWVSALVDDKSSLVVPAGGAILAGVSASTITNPIWLVKTRLQLESESMRRVAAASTTTTTSLTGGAPLATAQPAQGLIAGTIRCVRDVYRREGIVGFYRGMSASYAGTLETIIQFVIYERLKEFAAKVRADSADVLMTTPQLSTTTDSGWESDDSAFGQRESTQSLPKHRLSAQPSAAVPSNAETSKSLRDFVEYTTIAGVAKLVASISTYPHEVIRTRLREKPVGNVAKYRGFFHCLGKIAIDEGWRALYSGMPAHLARVVPNTAIMFLTYEIVVHLAQ